MPVWHSSLLSPTSDGAGAAVLASEAFVRRHGLENQAVEILAQEMVTDLATTFDENSCIKMVRNLCCFVLKNILNTNSFVKLSWMIVWQRIRNDFFVGLKPNNFLVPVTIKWFYFLRRSRITETNSNSEMCVELGIDWFTFSFYFSMPSAWSLSKHDTDITNNESAADSRRGPSGARKRLYITLFKFTLVLSKTCKTVKLNPRQIELVR